MDYFEISRALIYFQCYCVNRTVRNILQRMSQNDNSLKYLQPCVCSSWRHQQTDRDRDVKQTGLTKYGAAV